MSAATSTSTTMRRLGLVLAALLVLIIGALVLAPDETWPPLDPDSPAPDGLLGVIELLEAVDVDVDVSTDRPDDRSMKVFIPVDRLDDDAHERWEDWVRSGGTLVVADPMSPLHDLSPVEPPLDLAFGTSERPPACDLLDDVEVVRHGAWDGLTAPPDATTCFPFGPDEAAGPADEGDAADGEAAAWLVARSVGDGTVIALGSAGPLVNASLDEADNAVLAASLLAPRPGDRVQVVPRPEVSTPDQGLVDLVSGRAWLALALSAVAVLLAALWRGRRLGPPVAEHLPPVVPSAELARSVAGLLQRAGDREAAARRLRAGLRRDVVRTLGIGGQVEPVVLVDQLVARTGASRSDAERAVLDLPVGDEAALVAVADAARRVRAAARRGPDPAEAAATASTRSADPDQAGATVSAAGPAGPADQGAGRSGDAGTARAGGDPAPSPPADHATTDDPDRSDGPDG